MMLPFEDVKRSIAVKREADTDEAYGSLPNNRSTESLIKYGLINLNKPSGPTSHQVVDYVKRVLCLKKAGHSGTLELI